MILFVDFEVLNRFGVEPYGAVPMLKRCQSMRHLFRFQKTFRRWKTDSLKTPW
jgi:hypothetical protein